MTKIRFDLQVGAASQPASFSLPGFSVRGASWCTSRGCLVAAPWSSVSPLPDVQLRIFRSEQKEEEEEESENAKGRCQLVAGGTFDAGEAVSAAEGILAISLPSEGYFARTPLLTQE